MTEKLTPREPTQEMTLAGIHEMFADKGDLKLRELLKIVRKGWRAMHDAAPQTDALNENNVHLRARAERAEAALAAAQAVIEAADERRKYATSDEVMLWTAYDAARKVTP